MIRTIDLVPSSIREDPQVMAACRAIDYELEELYEELPTVAFWTHLDKVESPLLDVLMWEYHVDWTQNLVDGTPLTDQEKRDAIDRSIVWHQKKGTKWAVEQVLKTFWYDTAYVIENWQYGGNPFFFRIVVDQPITDPEMIARVEAAVMEVKNARSWLEDFVRSEESDLEYIYWAGASLRWKYVVSEAPIDPPVLDQMVPERMVPGANINITVTGSNFFPHSLIVFDEVEIPTTFMSGQTLRSTNPFNVGAEGTKIVKVRTNMIDSNSRPFTVLDSLDPELFSLDPDNAITGTSVELHCIGANFQQGANATMIDVDESGTGQGPWVEVPTTFVDTEEVRSTNPIPVGAVGTKAVRVRRSGAGDSHVSQSLPFFVLAPLTLDRLIPNSAMEDFILNTLVCEGTGFVASARIVWGEDDNGDPIYLGTTVESSTRCRTSGTLDVGKARVVDVYISDTRLPFFRVTARLGQPAKIERIEEPPKK